MKRSHVILISAVILLGVFAILIGVASYTHIQKRATLLNLPEASAIKQAFSAKTEWEKKMDASRESDQREKEAVNRKEKHNQKLLQLASRLGISSWTVRENQTYPDCQTTIEYYPLDFSTKSYTTNKPDCVLVKFIERAQRNKKLMRALELSRAANLSIWLSNGFEVPFQLSGLIVINADADDQTIINFLTVNAETNN